MAEKDLQKEVITYLRDKNIFCFAITPPDKKRKVFGTRYYLPDIYILKNGVSIFIELKAKEYSKNHADRQERQLNVRKEIIQNGGLAYLITSLDELKEII